MTPPLGIRGVRSGPGAARTILLLHVISVRPSKQPDDDPFIVLTEAKFNPYGTYIF